MNMLPDLDTFKLADAHKPRIGFRVVASGGEARLRNTLKPRHPKAEATSQTLLNHLCWGKGPSPFVSLWRSWSKAVRWAKSRERLGLRHIDIVAVWIDDQVVYDAHKAAITLPLPQKKRPEYFENEVIILRLGGENDYNILAWFYRVTERQWETVTFKLLLNGTPWHLSSTLPIGLLEFEVGSDEYEIERRETERWQQVGFSTLRGEIYYRTGCYDNSKVFNLAWILCGKPDPPAPLMLPRPTSQPITSDELNARLANMFI